MQKHLNAPWPKCNIRNPKGTKKGTWDVSTVCEKSHLIAWARKHNKTIHWGRVAPLSYEKGSELPGGSKDRMFRARTVFLGDQVRDQDSKAAVFEELTSAPAAMEALQAP